MTTKQRIEGTLHRDIGSVDVTTIRADGDNTRLTLSFSSETPYLRASYWDEPWNETLGHNPDECDLSRLNAGAPVLANHDRHGAADTSPLANIGIVERAWLENGKGYAEIKLSRRQEISGLLQDLADGIVRNVSVGYQIQERTLTQQNPEGQPNDYRVTRWMPMEISLVDIPADATVGVGRSAAAPPALYRVIDLPSVKDITMEQNQVSAPDVDAARNAGMQAERARIQEINDAVRGLRLESSLADDLIARGISADDARKIAITKAAERADATVTVSGTVETVRDETDVRRAGVAEALLHRYNPGTHKLTDAGRTYMGRSLMEISRDLLEAKGVRTTGMSRDQVATRAMHTTSDFPYILANVAGKTLRAAYESAPQTFKPFCRQVTAADFKTVQRTALGGAPALEKVNEHGEYKYGTVGEAKESYALASYGKIVALTRQTLINDDLDAFTRLPEMFGRAAADLESDTVWGIITANAAMADSVAIFHANHGNLPTGAAISVTQLGIVRAAMRKQTGIEGRIINVTPQYLLVPAALETIAQQFTSTAYMAEAGSNINPFAGTMQVIAEPRLDATSATAWYAAASPGQIDTIEYAYLEGNQGVFIESRDGWEVDGMEIKCRLDFGAAVIDYRGLCKGN